MELTKVIITIPKDKYQYIQELEYGNTDYATTRMLYHAIKKGTPLDSVKAEINKAYDDVTMYSCDEQVSRFASIVCGILNHIGKAESDLKDWTTEEILEQIRKENNDNPEDIGCDHNN